MAYTCEKSAAWTGGSFCSLLFEYALPPVQQAVMRMRNMEGMEYEDIARLIGSTPQAVRQVVSRARRAILDKYKSAQRLV